MNGHISDNDRTLFENLIKQYLGKKYRSVIKKYNKRWGAYSTIPIK